MDKNGLRKVMRNIKRQHSGIELERLSLAVIDKLTAHPRYVAARTLMLYHSLPDEVYTHRLLGSCKAGTILLPRVTGDGTMELRVYRGPDDLVEGAFNIMEPCGEVFTDYQSVDLAVIPGMAFDRSCHRLGRGKGYYDRFLPGLTGAYKIGLCFPFQLVDNVPTDVNDVSVDEIIC